MDSLQYNHFFNRNSVFLNNRSIDSPACLCVPQLDRVLPGHRTKTG